jgi:hypothetical protein
MQKSIFPQKIQKSLCITTKSLYTNSNFKCNYLENYNDSEDAVKTKNAQFFMIFPNLSFFHMIVNYWTGPLSLSISLSLNISLSLSLNISLNLNLSLSIKLSLRILDHDKCHTNSELASKIV